MPCVHEIWVTGWSFYVTWGWTVTLSPFCCHVLWNMLAAFVRLWPVLLFWQFHSAVPSCTVMLSSLSQYDRWDSGLHGSILTWATWHKTAHPWDTARSHSKESLKGSNIRWFLLLSGLFLICLDSKLLTS